MESPAGQAPDAVKPQTALAGEPWEHDFFQALRRIQCEHPQLPRLGHSLRLAEDPLRLGQRPDMAFAPSTLAAWVPGEDGAPPRLEQHFFGLTGPNGPLPLHLTDFIRDRERNLGDATPKAFLDLFHHRLLSLFYRAWAEARPTASHDRPDDDYWSPRLAALTGRGMPSLRGIGPLPEDAKHHYAGHLAAQTRYPDGLRAILSEYLGVPVQLEEFIGQWLPLPEHSQLGRCQLGVDTCLGSHVWDRQHKFRLRLGPLSLAQYHHLLPGAAAWSDVAAWVREYQGLELDWELNLVLGHAHIPALPLDGSGRLGFDSWLGKPAGDAADLLLSHHYANDFKERDRTHE